MSAADAADDPVTGELLLLDPAVRADRARVDALLDPDFSEIGASGRRWSRAGILDLLAAEPGPGTLATQVRVRALSDDLVLVSYESDTAGRRALRTSLWRWSASGWRLLHHQGTPVP